MAWPHRKPQFFFTTFYEDGTGKPFRPADAGRMISRAAKAPVFGLFETLVGDGGIVGGVMVNQGQDAERAASMAIDILKGKKITEPLTVMPTPLVPMFDRQQLDRWGFRDKIFHPEAWWSTAQSCSGCNTEDIFLEA